MAINVDALRDFTTARAHFVEARAWIAAEAAAQTVEPVAARAAVKVGAVLAAVLAAVRAAVEAEAVQAARVAAAGVFAVHLHLLPQAPLRPIARLKWSASQVISVTTTSSTREAANCAQVGVE